MRCAAVPWVVGSSPSLGHRFGPRLRPQCHQCFWICLTATSMWVKVTCLPCHIHTYTVYTSIGGKGRCCTRRDLQDHHMQARKSGGKRSTLVWNPWGRTHEVAPQNGPWSNTFFKKNMIKYTMLLSQYYLQVKVPRQTSASLIHSQDMKWIMGLHLNSLKSTFDKTITRIALKWSTVSSLNVAFYSFNMFDTRRRLLYEVFIYISSVFSGTFFRVF